MKFREDANPLGKVPEVCDDELSLDPELVDVTGCRELIDVTGCGNIDEAADTVFSVTVKLIFTRLVTFHLGTVVVLESTV